MIAMRWRLLAPLLGLLAAAGGCGSPPYVQVETEVHGDGSCDRTIWQPEGELLPPEARRPEWSERWSSVRPILAPPAFAGKVGKGGDRTYFTAVGSFRDPGKIPSHYRHAIEGHPETGVSELARSYERRDFGFVIEHRWSERLTNIVTRAGFLKARDEFLELAMPLAARGIELVYGGKYDVTGFLRYLQTEGRRFLEQAAEALYDSSVTHEPERQQAVRLARIAERFGLDLFDAKGDLVTSVEGDARLEDFFRHRVLLGLRHRDGSRLTEAELRSLFPKDSDSPFEKHWESFFKEHEKEFESKLVPRILRMTGLYGYPLGLGAPSPEFAFALRLPGEVVEANGKPQGRDRVHWQFTGDRSFPDGFTMTARSVEIDAEVQKKVLGRVAIGDRAAAEALIRILGQEGPLLEAVRLARQKENPAPLRDFRPSSDEERDRFARLCELLKPTR